MNKKIFIFKQLTLLLSFCFIVSCSGYRGYKDIDPPELMLSTIMGKDVLFQFDEQLSLARFYDGNGVISDITQRFPTANVRLDSNLFVSRKPGNLYVKASDTSGNSSVSVEKIPIINDNPPVLFIEEIRLKYSKKRNQYVTVMAVKGGCLRGFSVTYQSGREVDLIGLGEGEIRAGERLKLEIVKGDKLSADFKHEPVGMKSRLSQSAGVVAIIDNNKTCHSYIHYYDGKKRSLDDYLKSSTSARCLKFLKSLSDDGREITCVTGNTTKKVIRREAGGRYSVVKK